MSCRLGARLALLGFALIVAVGAPLRANDLPRPAERVILTVAGAIARTNSPGQAEFDHAMLEQIGTTRLRTWTPWTEGEPEFEGVLARQLMAALGATGTAVRAVALNDFESTIPLADFDRYPVLLATRIDGKRLEVRDKGPIWIVYPWSDHPELDDLPTRRKSVWQLTSLHVQ
ncbi:MAG TPA: hypothetical protein VLE23_00500 [Geminicoccaceae bacterium]|nr:hypothetical protein [Geminicoccaceae bacterium]